MTKTITPPISPEPDVTGIAAAFAQGRVLEAETAALRVLERAPGHVQALAIVAQCAAARDDHERAARFWERAVIGHPEDERLLHQLVLAQLGCQDYSGADAQLRAAWQSRQRLAAENWLLWGYVNQHLGRPLVALKAWFRAVHHAQQEGRWLNEATTPTNIRAIVLSAMRQVAAGRRELFIGTLDRVRSQTGHASLARVDRALAHYLRERDDAPPDPRQRPKFLYIPGLPGQPYEDPYLQSWSQSLDDAFPVIRAEALRLLSDDERFEPFLSFGPQTRTSDYVGGDGEKPSWDAFFFYRHGRRYDSNHARCPQTSEVLDSIDLCRIKGQAPEVCFSLLAPGSHIMPHYGVTNSRLVMHLPLKVPRDCALNVIGVGEHHWQEGRLMMFDDTFQHEAWNRSADTRLILLMDCWNPHLAPEERLAITALIECISDFENVF